MELSMDQAELSRLIYAYRVYLDEAENRHDLEFEAVSDSIYALLDPIVDSRLDDAETIYSVTPAQWKHLRAAVLTQISTLGRIYGVVNAPYPSLLAKLDDVALAIHVEDSLGPLSLFR